MVVSKKLIAAAIGGLMLTAYAPAWAGSAENAAPATQSASVFSGDRTVLDALTPILSNTGLHQAQPTCKADSLYSGHDVIGDPEACVNSRVDARATGINPGVSGAL